LTLRSGAAVPACGAMPPPRQFNQMTTASATTAPASRSAQQHQPVGTGCVNACLPYKYSS